MTVKPFKIKVESKSHSIDIQEWLFSLGYSWCSGSTDVDKLDSKFLILYEDVGEDLTIGCTSSSKVFEESDLPEMWFYDGKLQDKPQTLPEFKIKVESPEHSRKVQEFVFSRGYHWWNTISAPIQEVKSPECPYLYFNRALKENAPTLSATAHRGVFDSMDIPEMWFYDDQLQDKPKPETQTQLQSRTYRQVAEALLSGQKLQFLDPSGDWISINYLGLHTHQLDREYPYEVRVKPRICNGVELDPCLTEPPKSGNYYYYYPDPMHVDFFGMKPWANDADDIYWLELGFVYDSVESAAKHGKAMGKYEMKE